VRFSHRLHDSFTGGDCGVCHHRVTFDEEDRFGVGLQELHSMMEIRLGGACSSCHGDFADNTPHGCAHCHSRPNQPDDPARPGLKGAFHRQCIGCHRQHPETANAPTACDSCHHPLIPFHGELVGELALAEGPQAVTRRCLDCHLETAEDVLRSVHWKWGGHSPSVAGYEHHVDLGVGTVLNNYLICAGANPQNCAACHVGFGPAMDPADAADPLGIDCLICHDVTGTYRKRSGGGGEPDPGVDLAGVAASVGRPGRTNCGRCHFYSDGGANVKHGDLEPALAHPPPDFDVHMGRAHMLCQDCHRVSEHRIAGRSMTAPASEGEVRCEDCHGVRPHRIAGVLGPHLDDHARSVACETCHIPHVAKETPTQIFLDYSTAGGEREPTRDSYGMPTWEKRCGEMRWTKNLVPTYLWFDGARDAYVLGEKINPRQTTVLNAPRGDRRHPSARIAPFKVHTAVQPYDSENDILVTPQLSEAFWDDFEWAAAIADGMEATGLEYSGSYDFTTTVMYSGLHHEVVPKEMSLGCGDCHAREAVACGRCHRSLQGADPPAHTGRTYPDEDLRLDFAELGYEDDPALIGGRFSVWPDVPTAPR
jgi:octaheme c-type cytochrome (tetrathionate reductase family)